MRFDTIYLVLIFIVADRMLAQQNTDHSTEVNLYDYARADDFSTVQALVAHGINPNSVNELGIIMIF